MASERKKKIAIGIPCYGDFSAEVAADYMRMMFTFGRRYTDYDFFLIYKTKSEQFRARNAIVETALVAGADYLLFLDDDQIIDWRRLPKHDAYEFLRVLLDADKDIVGALYYHRGGDYRPVVMKQYGTAYKFLRDDEITGGLQEVDVQGGGCTLINMRIFDKIKPPYFEPEMHSNGEGPNYGTDIQLCRKAKEAGFGVWCHTGVVVGHLKKQHDVVTPENREMYMAEAANRKGSQADWLNHKWYKEYLDDSIVYTGMTLEEMKAAFYEYNNFHLKKFSEFQDKADYYRQAGPMQLARQVGYHSNVAMLNQAKIITTTLAKGIKGHGLDYGCGSAPVGFQLLGMGHKIDFVDIEGTYSYDFLKWRVKERGLEGRAGWKLGGPYDFVLLLDAIEHWENWQEILDNIISRMRNKAGLITNFFYNMDYDNPEHVSMDHMAVQEFLLERRVYPTNQLIWVKQDTIGPSRSLFKKGKAPQCA